MTDVTLRVNGESHIVTIDDPATPLLYVLRDDRAAAREAARRG